LSVECLRVRTCFWRAPKYGLRMGCYLEGYRARVGTWAGGFSWRGGSKPADDIGTTGKCLDFNILSLLILAVFLVIGGIKQNPGPAAELENTVRILCSGCGRNLKSGIQCELCVRWCYYSCGNVKSQTAEREKWCCEKC
jgi:hypothetical protein